MVIFAEAEKMFIKMYSEGHGEKGKYWWWSSYSIVGRKEWCGRPQRLYFNLTALKTGLRFWSISLTFAAGVICIMDFRRLWFVYHCLLTLQLASTKQRTFSISAFLPIRKLWSSLPCGIWASPSLLAFCHLLKRQVSHWVSEQVVEGGCFILLGDYKRLVLCLMLLIIALHLYIYVNWYTSRFDTLV